MNDAHERYRALLIGSLIVVLVAPAVRTWEAHHKYLSAYDALREQLISDYGYESFRQLQNAAFECVGEPARTRMHRIIDKLDAHPTLAAGLLALCVKEGAA